MCIAAAGKIISINGRKATVSYGQETRMAMIGDTVPVVGDYVLVQMGIVVQKLSEEEAVESMKGWGMIPE